MGLKRWDGEEFMTGGTIRRWTGTDWNPPLRIRPTALGAQGYFSAREIGGGEGDALSALNLGNVQMTYGGGEPILRKTNMNGSPSIEFNNGRFYTTSQIMNLGENFTVMVVIMASTSNADGMAWMTGQESPNARRALWMQGRASANFSGYNANVISGVSTASPCVVSITKDNGAVTIRKNGTVVATGTPYLVNYNYEGFAIGANVSGSEQFTGWISEFAAWNTPLAFEYQAVLEQGWMGDYQI